jgi:hypothetical protein
MPRPGRTFTCLVSFAALLALWSRFAPVDRNFTFNEADFLKHQWRSCADVMIVGDSAVAWTLDPRDIEKELPGLRVVNFGIAAVTLSGRYIETIERVLDPAAPARVLIVGFSEGSTNRKLSWDSFKEVDDMVANDPPRVERTWREHLEIALGARSLCSTLFGVCGHRAITTVGTSGLVRNMRSPPDTDLLSLFAEVVLEPESTYSLELLGPFFERVRGWTASGIIVVGFVTPVDARRAALARTRGVSYQPMLDAFVAAGGKVLELPYTAETFDGMHMPPGAARIYAHEIGRSVAKLLGLDPNVQRPRRAGRCPWPS